MAASAPLFYSFSPRIISRRHKNSVNPPSSSSSCCSPSPYSSYSNFSSRRPGRCWNCITHSGSLFLSLSNTVMCGRGFTVSIFIILWFIYRRWNCGISEIWWLTCFTVKNWCPYSLAIWLLNLFIFTESRSRSLWSLYAC